MTPEQFRTHAHTLVDWMADYLRDVGSRPVTPDVAPGQVRAQLPVAAPEAGEPFESIMADLDQIIMPGMTHWPHPGWFAYFAANNSPPSVLAEMCIAALGAQCMSWNTSPAATELEQVTMDWLRQLIGLPETFTGVIQDTASTATLVAIISARERARERHGNAPLAVYASRESHSSVAKAVRLAGLGDTAFRPVAVDADFALRPDALESMIAADRAGGIVPACIVGTIGTTSSTAIDPIPAIAAIAEAHGAWLHVDAAWAGSAALLPECRSYFAGLERADSYVFNPHKWLLTNFFCSAYFVRDVPQLLRACSASPEYLRAAHDGEVVNYRDWGIALGRRFRALKLWFVLRSYGADGIRAMLRRHLDLATRFRAWVEAEPGFEVMAPSPFALVCFRHRPAGMPDGDALDHHNAALLDRVNASRRVFLTHTRLGDHYTLRMAIGQWQTGEEHVALAWQLIREAAGRLDG
jgi:aromatic-L-amino-acid decarboxylase